MELDFKEMKNFKELLLFIILLSMTTFVWADSVVESIFVEHQQRSFVLYQPQGVIPTRGYPLVLAFHGGGMNGQGMEKISLLDQQADQHKFMVIYPDGIDHHWNDGRSTIWNPQDDVAFILALLAHVEQHHHIDISRVFATGISNGALFAERLGCELSDKIAGIAPVAGTLPRDLIDQCHPTQKLAVLQINGNMDPIMPYEGGSVKDFHGRGEGGSVTSVAETAAFWARHNTCKNQGRSEILPAVASLDRTRILQFNYQGCPSYAAVQVYTVIHGGHMWPGGNQPVRPFITGLPSRQMNASAVISDFFLSVNRQ